MKGDPKSKDSFDSCIVKLSLAGIVTVPVFVDRKIDIVSSGVNLYSFEL